MTGQFLFRMGSDLKRQQKWLREKGFDDGYAGRPASLTNAMYQTAWQNGRKKRESDDSSSRNEA